MTDTNQPIAFDAQSFILNGQRTFLTSGAIHYPRIPRELWKDRILKAKAAGLNTLQLYFFWNVHEPEEGLFDFTGNADVAHFLDLIAEQDMWIVVRPGPYISAEWDGGGFPAWLYTKKGVQTRTLNPIYLEAVENYWNRLLPIFAPRQVTNGGKIILCQIENELNLGGNQGRAQERYMDALVAIARRNGINVPLITCEGQIEGAVECVNAHRPADRFADYRKRQPDKPLHCTEFWPGWYDVWNIPIETAPAWGGGNPYEPAFTERETWRVLAMGGAGYNYYMWHGGTNFAYTSMQLQTTSYYDKAPLTETGGLWDKYHRTRRIALFAQTFSEVLLNAPVYDPDDHQQTLRDGVLLHRRETDQGRVWFVENRTEEPVVVDFSALGDEKLPEAVRVPADSVRPVVSGWSVEGLPVPASARVPIHVVRTDRETVVVEWDPDAPDTTGEPCAVRRETAPDGRPVTFLTLTGTQWETTWFTDDGRILVGPYFLRGDQMEIAPGTTEVWVYADGQWTRRSVEPDALPPSPALGDWQAAPAADEAAPGYDDAAGWAAMFQPINRVHLGDVAGYSWYRSAFDSPTAREATLTLTALADRALLWVNGEFVAASECPVEERAADPSLTARIRLKAGRNTVAVLSDNLGHLKGAWCFKGRPLEEDKKGLFGPVLLDHLTEVTDWTFRPKLSWERCPDEIVWDAPAEVPGPARYWRASFALSPEELALPDRELVAYLDGLGKGVLFVNGRNLGRYWVINGHRRYYIPKRWLRERNEIVLFEETDAAPDGISLAWASEAIAGTEPI